MFDSNEKNDDMQTSAYFKSTGEALIKSMENYSKISIVEEAIRRISKLNFDELKAAQKDPYLERVKIIRDALITLKRIILEKPEDYQKSPLRYNYAREALSDALTYSTNDYLRASEYTGDAYDSVNEALKNMNRR